jgi:hypothetical protein
LLFLVVAQLLVVAGWNWWWGGWNYGLRLFVPALPVLAVLAACGLARLGEAALNRAGIFFTVAGLLFAIPCVLVDLAAGYGEDYNGTAESFRLDGHPLFSAFRYLDHLFATSPLDLQGVDILWMRIARQTGGWSLLPMLILLIAAVILAVRTLKAARTLAPAAVDSSPQTASSAAAMAPAAAVSND